MKKTMKKPRGLAGLRTVARKRIASLGGKAAQKKGTANRFTSITGRKAGRIGGKKVSRDVAHMAHIGRMGSRARWAEHKGE